MSPRGVVFRVAVAASGDGAEELALRLERRIRQAFPAEDYGVEVIAWGGAVVDVTTDVRVRCVDLEALDSASEVDGVGPFLGSVRVRRQRPVVVEVQQHSCRYPEPLMTVAGVRVCGLSVKASFVRRGKPEPAAPFGSDQFELLRHLVEDVITGPDLEPSVEDGLGVNARWREAAGINDQSRHDASPSTGKGAEPGGASMPSVGADRAAGGPVLGSPAARIVRWDLEIPFPEEAELVTRVTKGSYVYLGVALDAIDGVEEGQHRIALTLVEARDLHAALGAALAAENFPAKS